MSFMEVKKDTVVWKHFLHSKELELAKCKICQKDIKCKGGSTSALRTHLKSIHEIVIPTSSFNERNNDHSVKKIDNYFTPQKDSLAVVLTELISVDGIPFRVLTTSRRLRDALTAQGYNVPSSATTIKSILMNHCQELKANFREQFNKLKSDNFRFSITLDEYTSSRSRRYMNLNVHMEQRHWNLGMVRVFGSMPADKAVTIVKDKLNDFGLSLDSDIVAATTDGASVMKKFGNHIPPIHQLCIAHGIHLAVCDVLYKNIQSKEDEIDTDESHADCLPVEDEVADSDDDEEDGYLEVITEEENIPDVREDLKTIIAKVRKCVRYFRKSPVKNDILQKHVQSEFRKEMKLILDTKTRWNSLFEMISRFVKLKKCIRISLIDISSNVEFSETEFTLLEDLVTALEALKIGTEALCRRDVNLLSADGILKFIHDQLISQNNDFSKELLLSFIKRVNQRRNLSIINLLQYLNNQDSLNDEKDVFNNIKPKKNTIANTAANLFSRLFQNNEANEVIGDNEIQDDELFVSGTTLSEQLEFSIKEATRAPLPKKMRIETNSKLMLKEMAVYELTGNRTANLELLFNALKSIPVTSVEAERSFSASGLFVTKLRSRLNDETIDTLCFLRAFYLSKKIKK